MGPSYHFVRVRSWTTPDDSHIEETLIGAIKAARTAGTEALATAKSRLRRFRESREALEQCGQHCGEDLAARDVVYVINASDGDGGCWYEGAYHTECFAQARERFTASGEAGISYHLDGIHDPVTPFLFYGDTQRALAQLTSTVMRLVAALVGVQGELRQLRSAVENGGSAWGLGRGLVGPEVTHAIGFPLPHKPQGAGLIQDDESSPKPKPGRSSSRRKRDR